MKYTNLALLAVLLVLSSSLSVERHSQALPQNLNRGNQTNIQNSSNTAQQQQQQQPQLTRVEIAHLSTKNVVTYLAPAGSLASAGWVWARFVNQNQNQPLYVLPNFVSKTFRIIYQWQDSSKRTINSYLMTDKWKDFFGWEYLFFGDPNQYPASSGYCLDFVLENVNGFLGNGRLYCKEVDKYGKADNFYVTRDDKNDPNNNQIQKNAFVGDSDYMNAHS